MKLTTLIICLFFACNFAAGQTGIPVAQMTTCDNLVSQFLTKYDIPSATFAMAKNGKLVYMRAFGHADLAKTELTQPHNLFRIASLSKPITSIAVMKLVENGQLSLSAKAFGPGGILENHPYLSTVTPTDQRIYDITVQQLLEHSAGWNRDISCVPSPTTPYPWNAGSCDPIGFPLHVTQTLGEPNPVTEGMLIRFLMQKGLNFAPGTQYAYSNIGYLVLGEIIEAVTGKSYEEYLTEDIFAPIGICDMHIGKNLLADKQEREGEYHGNGYTAPSLYGSGGNVPWEYGGWNLEAMDAHGGWIATARDLVRLLTAVDGFSTRPDILSASTIATMSTASANQQYYAKGWSVNGANHWWHTGALDGTASIFVRTNNGYTWALILNKRIIDNRSNQFWADLDNLPWSCVSQTSTWPTHDFFDVPSQNSFDINFNGVSNSSIGVSWQKGNGSKRLLVAKEGAEVDAFPLDGESYAANAAFGQGDDLGNGNFVMSNDANNSVILTNLDPTKTYYFRLFEYNQSASTGSNALYQLCDVTVATATTASVGIAPSLEALGIRVYPIPTRDVLTIELPSQSLCEWVELRNLQGQLLQSVAISGERQTISLEKHAGQVFLLSFFSKDGYLGSERVVKQ
ncbi:MAG: serine hydrolase [Bacteroidia bacterium]|nr:serine hydrolase [Bacteroidia bacterium]